MAQQVSDFTRVRLANGVSVFQRGPKMLQFGMDATRTGIIETPSARQLQPILDAASQPRQLRHLTADVRAVIGAEAAASLLAELLSYRIIVPVTPTQLLVLGNSPLSQALCQLLERCGPSVHTPKNHGSELEFLRTADPCSPLVVVDSLSRARAVAKLAKTRSGPTVPVMLVDSKVILGPLRLSPRDPCPACLHLYLLDRVAGWDLALHQLPAGPLQPDPVVLAAGAAAAAAYIRRVAGLPDPPGVEAGPPAPGQVVVIDPFGPQLRTEHMLRPHPRCQVCY